MSLPPPIIIPEDIHLTKKLPQNDSPASSTGIPAAHGSQIPSYPLLTPTAPTTPSPPLRQGSIVKKIPRSASGIKSSPGYRLRDRSGVCMGRWVFIVNGTKLKQWDDLSPRLLKQLSSVEVIMCCFL